MTTLAAISSEPAAPEPVAAEPVAAEPVAAEPVAAEPVAAEPPWVPVDWEWMLATGCWRPVGAARRPRAAHGGTTATARGVGSP